MTGLLCRLTTLWMRFCAWRAGYWLEAWRGRQEAAEFARTRYRLWLDRAGTPSPPEQG